MPPYFIRVEGIWSDSAACTLISSVTVVMSLDSSGLRDPYPSYPSEAKNTINTVTIPQQDMH